jgi:hypothetical protein
VKLVISVSRADGLVWCVANQVPKGVLPVAATALNAILKPHTRMLLGNMGTQEALHTLFSAWIASVGRDPKRPSRDQFAFASLVLTVLLGINDDPSLLSVYYGTYSQSACPGTSKRFSNGPQCAFCWVPLCPFAIP